MSEEPKTQSEFGLPNRISTTSFLTAATLIYATGAGITAGAGTRTCPPVDTR